MTTESQTEKQAGWAPATKIALVSLCVSLGAFGVAGYQAWMARQTQDRASGKIKAKFEFVQVGNTDERSLAPLYKKSSLGFEAVTLDDVKQFLNWNPYVEVKNTGDEVIDGLRVEVRFTSGMIVHKEVHILKPTPYVLDETSELDLPLKEKLHPGQTATVSIIKPLVGQLVQAQAEDRSELEHIGHFEIRVYAKPAGGPNVMDRPEPFKSARLHLIWFPKGFTKDACKGILESHPHVQITGS